MLLGRSLVENARSASARPTCSTPCNTTTTSSQTNTCSSDRERHQGATEVVECTIRPAQVRLVFKVDEITRLSLLPYWMLLQFRSLFLSEPRVRAVLSGRGIDRTRDRAGDSPWWNFIGKEVEVQPLTPTKARRAGRQAGAKPLRLRRRRLPVDPLAVRAGRFCSNSSAAMCSCISTTT